MSEKDPPVETPQVEADKASAEIPATPVEAVQAPSSQDSGHESTPGPEKDKPQDAPKAEEKQEQSELKLEADSQPEQEPEAKSEEKPPVENKVKEGGESQENEDKPNSGNRGEDGREGRPRRGRNNQRNRKSGRGRRNQGKEGEDNEEGRSSEDGEGKDNEGDGPPRKTRKERYLERKEKERAKEAAALEAAPAVESEGLVEISPKGFGFLRERGRSYQQSPKDVFITPEIVRIHGLRDGLWLKCVSKQGIRGPQMIELLTINGKDPAEYQNLPYFEELTAINPNKKLTLETDASRMTTRVIDMMAPIGRGQRGLIVAPPRTGKTTLLHHIAEGIQKNYDDEIHLMILLVDERPEEVTDFKRSFPDLEVFSSSNDGEGKDHTRIALLAIERAKRLVEAGEHVFILMDSITRLARAFNTSMRSGKRGTASGGLIVGALEVPRRIFAAARNTREAGSLTIIATALIQTNSKADEAIFQEFKGTGNMELVLDRALAQNYVYPAVDIHKSGTRREELLLPPHMLEKIYVIRRGLGGYKQVDAMEWLLKCMERYPSNAQMLMDIKTTALS